eukprot:Plantae.Rhodophyta-Purpureofilum_apyrenoidigerum.ctg2914.p1 GENE.Plantae.Rhodophyta-Purpureofilum_apyrenoidigerum.ctg2914~~Plantae.Rhodophyta-Purpureofilum_apyrenoidigerum.ctg2914.p1  ORF type:complete len:559 (+),score=97.87 Plantae.Rhodophyta-Purpureofilum_apyrenoidigerum.ctg2914:165-1679(+)
MAKSKDTEDNRTMDDMTEEVEGIVKMVEKAALVETEDVYKVKANEEEFDNEFKVNQAPRKYKIAMFAWESLHSIAVGGVAPHLTNLAAGHERRGHEVHVFVRTGAGQKQYEQIDGVHIHRVCFNLDANFVNEIHNMCNAMVHEFFETERFMASQFDIVHAHDWLAAPALINIKYNHNRKCIFTVHSTEFGRCGNNIYGGESEKIRGIESEAINAADRVIGVSGVLCDEIKEHYSFCWDNLRRVYNGIECLPYDGELWDPAYIRGLYNVGAMDPMVLFVGRMATQKGPDILIEAIPMILNSRPDAKFVMVGDGYMKEDLISRCAQLGISGSVFWTGSMGGQRLIDLFKATDVVCIPSRNEPFGIVTLEAWAAHKPVVVTKNGGPREFVWHDNDGFVVDATSTGIAWGIGSCFANFDHSRHMGAQGRVKAAFQFSWDRIAEITNDVYDELFGIFPPPPEEDKSREQAAVEKRTVATKTVEQHKPSSRKIVRPVTKENISAQPEMGA